MGEIGNRVNDNRIVYIDPNDAHGHYGMAGKQAVMTPDYSDMTLWCNLVVETSSRLKNQGSGTDSSGVYYINFDLTKASYGSNYVSFMQGADVDRYNYLTTQYTEADFNEIRKKNMVEGLLIEDISVDMANFTCPQVKMKFVDVRGSGFFGREEATHNAYGNLNNLEQKNNGDLIDNFYSCFVSFPYPRFKLQIKGFYGAPVTYQLTCSNFEGNFNSSNGNFELNVQFIGYEYGVLGDIPFDYIVAAPLTKIGSDYWDRQVEIAQNSNSNEWMLATNEPPCKLFDFYAKISSSIEEAGDEDINEELLSDDVSTTISQGDKQIEMLNGILYNVNNFKTLLRNTYNRYITEVSTDSEEYMIIHSTTNNGVVSNNLADAYNLIGTSLDEYTDIFYESKVNSTIMPNGGTDGYWHHWEYGPVEFGTFTSYRNNNNDIGSNIIVARTGNVVSGERVNNKSSFINVNVPCYKGYTDTSSDSEAGISSSVSIKEGLSEQLYENYNNWEWCLTGSGYAGYAAIIDFNCITSIIKERILEIKVKLDEYKSLINKGPSKTISSMVGFSPYVANYFKVVMCHLETFVYLFRSTADAIQSQINYGKRTPANLGIYNLDYQTDVPSSLIKNNKQVPHFPSVYKKYSVEEEIINTTPDSKDIVASAWIGDFKGSTEWEEKVLVDDLYNALKRINSSRGNSASVSSSKSTNTSYGNFSLFGRDVFRTIPAYSYQSKDNLAFYTGVRAEAIFGLYNYGDRNQVKDDYASKFGAIDALNMINQCGNSSKLADIVKVSSDGSTLADELYNIVTNNNSGQSNIYDFELVKVTNGRQPVFVKNSSKLTYSYMPGDNGVNIVPMDEFNRLSNNTLKQNYTWNNKKFKVNDKDSQSYMFTGGTNSFVRYNDDIPSTTSDDDIISSLNNYTNTQMFDIFNGYNGSYVDSSFGCKDLMKAYDGFSKGETKVGTMSGDKFKDVTNEYWLMDNYCLTYFRKKRNDCKTYKDLGIEVNSLVRSDGSIPANLSSVNTAESTDKFIKSFMEKV